MPRRAAAQGTPLLGICLGRQRLFERSAEFGSNAGLSILPGTVDPIPPAAGLRVPHMGWNQNRATRSTPIAESLDGQFTYFVHSLYARTSSDLVSAVVD